MLIQMVIFLSKTFELCLTEASERSQEKYSREIRGDVNNCIVQILLILSCNFVRIE